MKNLNLLIFLFSLCTFTATSQLTTTAYSTYAIGIETKLTKDLSGEFRIYTNNILDDTNMEAQFYYGFSPRKFHQIRIGAGINGNLFEGEVNSLQMPVQLHIFPFQDLKRLAFVIEFAPQWFTYDPIGTDNLILRNLWGLRYTFGGE
ncbi:MAG: hypothetical protein IPM42_06245 [Saprospiraceae bacterium]|nr:hypothetical protein [Saprospiraceae bacterium]